MRSDLSLALNEPSLYLNTEQHDQLKETDVEMQRLAQQYFSHMTWNMQNGIVNQGGGICLFLAIIQQLRAGGWLNYLLRVGFPVLWDEERQANWLRDQALATLVDAKVFVLNFNCRT